MSLARVLQFLDIAGVEDWLQWLHMRLERRRIQLRSTHFGGPPNISVGMAVAYVDVRKQRIFSFYALVDLNFRCYDKLARLAYAVSTLITPCPLSWRPLRLVV